MRILSACLAALLALLAGCGGMASAQIDFSEMTLEELYAVRAQLDAAIEAREGAGDQSHYEDGRYLVGRDIPEGDYVLAEREGYMFASVLVRIGETDDAQLLLHKLITGQADIHLAKNTWVTLSGVQARPLDRQTASAVEDGAVGEGAYLVGVQLPAGRYEAVPDGKAPLSSYSIYTGILGTDAKQTGFVVLHETTELVLNDGEYVELSGCVLYPAE